MLTKIAAVLHSKIAIAVLGVILVGGGGGAVAVAATGGHLSTLGIQAALNSNAKSTETPDSHAHTVGVQGLLTACSTTTNQISVTDSAKKVWTFTVSETTKYNGDANTSQQGASSAKGDNSANAGASSAGDASTADTTHTAITLSQLCGFVNTRDVQVQATPNGANYDAWKVTLQGPGTGKSDSNGDSKGDSSSSTGAGDSSNGSNGSQNAPAPKAFEGTVTAVGSSSFTLVSRGTTYQVTVSATTALQGAATVNAIAVNSHAVVMGTLSGATITATSVAVSAPDTSGN